MFPQPDIRAQASVDPGAFEVADRVRDLPFVVTVTGSLVTGDPLPDRRYEIAAVDEPTAAFEGINRYLGEMRRAN